MAVNTVLDLDLNVFDVIPRIDVAQFDTTSRVLQFHILNNGESYTIPADTSVTLQGSKPDGNGFVHGCYIEETAQTTITTWCYEDMTAVAGDVYCQLVLVDSSDRRIGSFPFIMSVSRAGINSDTSMDPSQIAYVVQALNDIQSSGLLKFSGYTSETIEFVRIGNSEV